MVCDRIDEGMVGDRIDGDAFSQGEKRILRRNIAQSITPTDRPMMSRLAPFIQEYFHNQGWADLRPIQVEACRVVFDTDAHLLVAAGTASGKTEAAFLPVLTRLHDNPSNSIGALYIGPLKALINDQFERLTDLLQSAQIPVQMWHGDVTQSKKNQVLKNPQGILPITPGKVCWLTRAKTSIAYSVNCSLSSSTKSMPLLGAIAATKSSVSSLVWPILRTTNPDGLGSRQLWGITN
jgi:superfamily II DNA/RNA helicase